MPDILEKVWSVAGSGEGERRAMSVVEILQQHMFLMMQLGKILDIDMRQKKPQNCMMMGWYNVGCTYVQIFELVWR